jgi:hypothetical protein
MSQPESHPSFLELDRHALDRGGPQTAAHVAQCARCQQHLAALAAVELPPAGIGLLKPTRRVPRVWTAGLAFSGVAVAAALYLVLLHPGEPASHYDGVKGGPSVAVHVSRAGRVELWDHAPLRPGDRFRLEVAPSEFEYVSVFAAQGPSRLSMMYSGRVRVHGQTLLPKAWQLDAAPGAERVLVMFSHAQISEQAASTLLTAHDPRDVSVVWLTLPKSLR